MPPITVPAVSHDDLERKLTENTQMTQEVLDILKGKPEYKRKGLVELVDKHEAILTKYGAVLAFLVSAAAIYEAFKH